MNRSVHREAIGKDDACRQRFLSKA